MNVENCDFFPKQDSKEHYITARGVIKMSFFDRFTDNLPKPRKFMNEYCKLLSKKGYGKSAYSISKEVNRMDQDEGNKWIEWTYEKYIKDPMEVFNILQSL